MDVGQEAVEIVGDGLFQLGRYNQTFYTLLVGWVEITQSFLDCLVQIREATVLI